MRRGRSGRRGRRRTEVEEQSVVLMIVADLAAESELERRDGRKTERKRRRRERNGDDNDNTSASQRAQTALSGPYSP